MTQVQKISLSIAMLGFLAGAGTQLTDIFAPFGSMAPLIVKEIVTVSGFVSGGLGIFLSFISGQGSQVQAVQAMPGVASITINKNATPELAALAVDSTNAKIQPLPQDKRAVQEIAAAAL